MDIKTTEDDQTISISITGSSNPSEMKKLEQIVDSICSDKDKNIDIDLSGMEYIDSTCISTLLKLNKSQKQKNLDFKITKASTRVTSLLSLCSLSDTLMG